MEFSNLQDFQSRYISSFLDVEGVVSNVIDVYWHSSDLKDVQFHLQDSDGCRSVIFPFSDECNVQLDVDHSFYHKTRNGLIYLERDPRKRWRQGFVPNTYLSVSLEGGSRLNCPRPHRNFDTAKSFFKSQFDAPVMVDRNTVLSRSVAYDKTGFLYYKGHNIGSVHLGEDKRVVASVFKSFRGLTKTLEGLGLYVEICKRSKRELGMSVTIGQLDSLGVDEDLIQKILSSLQNDEVPETRESMRFQRPPTIDLADIIRPRATVTHSAEEW